MFCKHADVKEDTDSKSKSKAKKKEPASMFQINGDKPDTKSKKKGEMRCFLFTSAPHMYRCVICAVSDDVM